MRAIAAVTLCAACGGGTEQVIDTCTEQPPIDVSEVGQVVALARFKDGYVIGGLRFNTMRVATIDANGMVTPPSAIGTLPDIPVTSVPFRASFVVDGPVWTAVFPDQDSLLGYSVDTVGGDDSTLVYQNHFTNSEPYVLFYPTAFWFGSTPQQAHIAVQRVEISSGVETAAPYIWIGVGQLLQVHPGESAGASIAVIDGSTWRALAVDGVYDYDPAGGGVPRKMTVVPEEIVSLGAGTVGENGELTAAALASDGSARFLHVRSGGDLLVSATREGTPEAVGLLAIAPGSFAWLAPDATLHWRSFGGDEIGPSAPVTQPTGSMTAPGPDVVRSGNDFAYAFSDGTSWYLARQTCQ